MKKEIAFTAFGFSLILIVIMTLAYYFDKKMNAIAEAVDSSKNKPLVSNGIKVHPTTNRTPIGFSQKPKIDPTIKCRDLDSNKQDKNFHS